MSELETGTPARSNNIVYILLGVIAVLLVGVIIVITQQGGAKTASPTAPTGATGTGSTTTTPPAGMGTATPDTFDPATATKVPDGETPQQYVEAYFQALVDGDYQAAYDRLPQAKKASQDVASFTSQIKGYGITGFEMGDTTEEGQDTKVTCKAVTSGGNFTYIWTFTQVDGKWVVKAREIGGMG